MRPCVSRERTVILDPDRMRVFSDDFASQLRSGGGSSLVESLAVRQDPHVIRFREQIETWYGETDRNAQRTILPALRSRNDEEFYSAFFALALQRFVALNGWQSTFRPFEKEVPTFNVRIPTPTSEFDLEVATVLPRASSGRERSVQMLMAEISAIESQFIFAVHVRRWLPDDFDPGRVRSALEQWLAELSKDEQYASRRAQYLDDRIDIEFAILSKTDETRTNCIGLWLSPLDVEEHFEGLSQATESALTKARSNPTEAKKPFVVALCHGYTWGMVENTIMQALYGKPRSIRARSGFGGGRRKVYDYSRIFRKAIFNRPGNEMLSGVVFIETAWQGNEICYDMRVFHNPWATHPLPLEAFGILPQLVPAPQTNGGAQNGPILSWRNQMKQMVSLSGE